MDNATTQAQTFATTLKTTKSYLFGSQRVAMRVLTTNSDAVSYLHGDHPSTRLRTGLGSVSMSTNALGESESQARFTPFGEIPKPIHPPRPISIPVSERRPLN